MAKHLASSGCMSAYPSKEEAQKAKLVMEGEEDEEAMEEEAGEEDGDNKDEQQKEEEEEAFKKQCKTSPKKVGRKLSPDKSAEKERTGTESEETGEEGEKEPTVEAKDKSGDCEKGEEDEESPKPGGMLLFGTLFKYMDKDKEDGVRETMEQKTSDSKMDETPGDNGKEESVSMEEEGRSKAGEVDEPDLTTPPPPQDEMDTDSVPPSI